MSMVLSLYFAMDSKDKIACTSLIRPQMQFYVPIPNVHFFYIWKKHPASYDVAYIN
jgi:hypothetical protein